MLIVGLGFGLRVFQLGHDSFWNDEAGVALVAVEPTVKGALSAMRSHAMAMPLDYLIAWVVARMGVQEFLLRFPSVVWGTLTLATCHRFFRRLSEMKVATLAVLLLALSPLHVHYSQELRFYSSLIFFYCLSTLLLLEAIEYPLARKWILFTLVTAVGIYFHVYVLLSVVNGAIWLVLERRKSSQNGLRWLRFLIIGIALFVAFIPGYMYFGVRQRFNYSLLEWNASLIEPIGQGLGWLALPYTPSATWSWTWGALCFGLGLLGVATSFKRQQRYIMGLACSEVIQVVLIILADLLKGYWFVYRQLLHLLPFTFLLAASGTFAFGSWLQRISHVNGSRGAIERVVSAGNRGATAILIGVFALSAVPALSDYYNWPKSTAREISAAVATKWLPGDTVLVLPGYQEKIYRFYMQHVMGKKEIVPSIQPAAWARLSSDILDVDTTTNGGAFYLIVSTQLSGEEHERLASLGFRPFLVPNHGAWGGQSLFVKHRVGNSAEQGNGPR